ncbi:hypothetical protein Ancab_025920, partial [Ancistrocladus abbreviatus]
MLLVRVNEEISGECLFFLGDLPVHGNGNPQMISKNPVIGNTIGDERAWGTNTVERSSKAASFNNDNLAKSMRLAANGGERSKVAEGRVEREASLRVQGPIIVDSDIIMKQRPIDRKTQAGNLASPKTSLRELNRGHVVVGLGPVDRTNGEDIGPGNSPGQSVFRRAEGGVAYLGRGNHIKPRTKKEGVSNCGPGCSGSSGEPKKTSIGVPTPLGSSEILREENGNANTVSDSHQKSKSRKMGCRKPTMKLGVGPRQRTCGAKKKIKKQTAGSTINKAANSSGAS